LKPVTYRLAGQRGKARLALTAEPTLDAAKARLADAWHCEVIKIDWLEAPPPAGPQEQVYCTSVTAPPMTISGHTAPEDEMRWWPDLERAAIREADTLPLEEEEDLPWGVPGNLPPAWAISPAERLARVALR
jgi:hypothetical protein